MLARLRQWPYREAQRDAIEEAIKSYRWYSFMRKHCRVGDCREFSSRRHLPEMLPAARVSMAVHGTWRWMRSSGLGVDETPPTCGWSRTLFLGPDSTYSVWESDSAGQYQVCNGQFSLSPSEGRYPGYWIEFRGWTWSWNWPGTYLLQFLGQDLICIIPGRAGKPWHDTDQSHTFARARHEAVPPITISNTAWRPPRVIYSTRSGYRVEVPPPLGKARPLGFSEWPRTPKEYHYTNSQTPSGVIGDFDGDSLADAAIYGYDDHKQNLVLCLLSNHGSPHAVTAWHDPTPARSYLWGRTYRSEPPQPSVFLELCPLMQVFSDSARVATTLDRDAIFMVSKDGVRTPLYYMGSAFRVGRPGRIQ